jgi:hypothetical protein
MMMSSSTDQLSDYVATLDLVCALPARNMASSFGVGAQVRCRRAISCPPILPHRRAGLDTRDSAGSTKPAADLPVVPPAVVCREPALTEADDTMFRPSTSQDSHLVLMPSEAHYDRSNKDGSLTSAGNGMREDPYPRDDFNYYDGSPSADRQREKSTSLEEGEVDEEPQHELDCHRHSTRVEELFPQPPSGRNSLKVNESALARDGYLYLDER